MVKVIAAVALVGLFFGRNITTMLAVPGAAAEMLPRLLAVLAAVGFTYLAVRAGFRLLVRLSNAIGRGFVALSKAVVAAFKNHPATAAPAAVIAPTPEGHENTYVEHLDADMVVVPAEQQTQYIPVQPRPTGTQPQVLTDDDMVTV